MDKKTSAIPEFYKKTPAERLALVRDFAGLTDEEARALSEWGALGEETARGMIENTVGTTQLPLGFATNFLINGRDYLIPMAIEEPSVVAAASNAAKLCRPSGGFKTNSDEPVMIGQIQFVGAKSVLSAVRGVNAARDKLLAMANECDATLVERGGGARDLRARTLATPRGEMLVVELLVDVRDAMGANAVNSMCEALAPAIADLTKSEARLRIISNLATRRLSRAKAVWRARDLEESLKDSGLGLTGKQIVERILDGWAFASVDVHRACTHNKGIMNGVDAVCVACGQDWRAIEAGAHAYAAVLSGERTTYSPLTRFEETDKGDLIGFIELPTAVGIVGGATRTHPVARACLKVLSVKSAREFGEVLAAVGLAQNFAALRALATEGIQRGHMQLHARNIAILAGAVGDEIDLIASRLVEERRVKVDRARELLAEIRG
ncbi:MAG: hydroxymethylglutaryl-CoA reductase, degradative [Candidatus Norongarragalinales archaeon]